MMMSHCNGCMIWSENCIAIIFDWYRDYGMSHMINGNEYLKSQFHWNALKIMVMSSFVWVWTKHSCLLQSGERDLDLNLNKNLWSWILPLFHSECNRALMLIITSSGVRIATLALWAIQDTVICSSLTVFVLGSLTFRLNSIKRRLTSWKQNMIWLLLKGIMEPFVVLRYVGAFLQQSKDCSKEGKKPLKL